MVALFSFVAAFAFALSASQIAEANPTPAIYTPDLFPRLLNARQAPVNTSSIPAECQSQCAAMLKLQDCKASDLNCLCNDSGSDAYASCLDCGLSLDNSTSSANLAQAVMDEYVDVCKQAGHPVKSEKLSASKNGDLALRPELLGVLIAAGALAAVL